MNNDDCHFALTRQSSSSSDLVARQQGEDRQDEPPLPVKRVHNRRPPGRPSSGAFGGTEGRGPRRSPVRIALLGTHLLYCGDLMQAPASASTSCRFLGLRQLQNHTSCPLSGTRSTSSLDTSALCQLRHHGRAKLPHAAPLCVITARRRRRRPPHASAITTPLFVLCGRQVFSRPPGKARARAGPGERAREIEVRNPGELVRDCSPLVAGCCICMHSFMLKYLIVIAEWVRVEKVALFPH